MQATVYAGSSAYHCYCYDGFYGGNCTLYDPCFSAPCQNNGQCHNVTASLYQCRCRPGFHGANCQLYNPCADSPCLHAGMCNSIDGRFVCDCEPGYYGSVTATADTNSCACLTYTACQTSSRLGLDGIYNNTGVMTAHLANGMR